MSALIILNYDVHDPEEHAAELVATTAETRSLPEAPPAGTHTVVLRAASVAAAVELYESADYQRLLPARLAATTPRAAFVVPVA
jgi:uncharacterized protein (DUF1330 family)